MASVREGVSLTLSPCDEGAALAAVASASLAAAEWHRLAPSVYVREDWGALPAGEPAAVAVARACSGSRLAPPSSARLAVHASASHIVPWSLQAALEASGWAGGPVGSDAPSLARALLGCVAVALPALTEVTIIDVVTRYAGDGALVAAWEALTGRPLCRAFCFWVRVVPGDDDTASAPSGTGWLAPPTVLLLPPPLPALPARSASSAAALRALAGALGGPWMAGFFGGGAPTVVGVAVQEEEVGKVGGGGWAKAGALARGAPAGGAWTVRPLPPAVDRGVAPIGAELQAALARLRSTRSTAAAAPARALTGAPARPALPGCVPVLGKRKVVTMVGVRVAKPKAVPGFPPAAAAPNAKKPAGTAAAKRAPKAVVDPAALAAKADAVAAAFAAGAQATLGVDALKAFLKACGAKVGGKKANLLARAAGLLEEGAAAAVVET